MDYFTDYSNISYSKMPNANIPPHNINDNNMQMNINYMPTTNNDNSDADLTSDISDGRMCRYCFCEVLDEDNYSTCACRTALCRNCLERELCLTEGRQDHKMKCTVCNTEYTIQYVNQLAPTYCQQLLFSMKETFCCTNIQIQGNRMVSLREKIALALLMFFLALWTSATTYSIVDPGIERFDGFSAELLVYLFLVFMDWCVGFSMIWFVKLVDSLQLSLPFVLMVLHISRCCAVIFIRFVILGINDAWKFSGCAGMLCTSLCVISACLRLYVMTACNGYKRIQMRNVQIMVNGKGPFRLKDIDRYERREPPRNNNASRSQQIQRIDIEPSANPSEILQIEQEPI
eukprot:392565_1